MTQPYHPDKHKHRMPSMDALDRIVESLEMLKLDPRWSGKAESLQVRLQREYARLDLYNPYLVNKFIEQYQLAYADMIRDGP